MSDPAGVRVAVVGAGPMGRLHARTLARLMRSGVGCTFAGILDHHPGRACSAARALEVPALGDLDAVADAADVAVVAVPASAHLEVASALLARGLDLLVEKPLAASLEEGEALVERADACARLLQVGHVEWYNPAWRAAVERVGALRRIEVERVHPASDRGLDVDVVQDLMLHDLDWVTRRVGEPLESLDARGRSASGGRLEEVEAELRFRSGCTALLRASRLASSPRRRARIVGAQGEALADLAARTLVAADGRPLADPTGAATRPDPLEVQCRALLDAVSRRETPENDGAVGLAALRLVERVRTAALAAATEVERDEAPRLGG